MHCQVICKKIKNTIDKANILGYNNLAKSNRGGDNVKESQVKSILADVVRLLEPLDENEKKQAFALLQGMVIGKELADQQKTA